MRILRRHPEFAKLWAGQAISAFGSRITLVAMPLAAVVTLHASPAQMGVLAALAVLPHLLFGLMAGVWVDRWSRRSILVAADVGRALVLGSVPVLGILGWLRIEHLYAVAFLAGTMTLLFDTAATSLVPALVGRDDLVQANSAWLLNTTVATTAGPSVAGGLVQALGATTTIAIDAASFLLSAACSLLVAGAPGPPPGPRSVRLRAEIGEGLRAMFGSPVLAAVAVSATVGALAGAMQAPLLVLYLVRDLSLAPVLVGAVVTVAGAASVAGALLAPAVAGRLGPGPTYILGQLLYALGGPLLALAQGPPAAVAALLVLGQAAAGVGWPLFGVPQASLRQALVPDRVLGRVNASWRFLVFGVQPLGALLGGALGSAVGPRAALVLSGVGVLAGCLWAVRSPLRTLRQVPAPSGSG